jgi:two-component system cell cycle sensor histidine kinase/response regulator CckA
VVHCYGTDITERLQLEAQVRQSQKMDSVGQLAAAVAHDFNNILMIIQGYTSLLMAQRELPPELGEPLKQISSASERATNLTRQLMTFSRKQTMAPQVLDLGEVINNMAYLLRRVIGEAIAQQLNFSPNLPPIQADPGMMEQIIMNLTINARDAMKQGGTLTIATKSVEIDEEYVRRNPEAQVGRCVCLSISDTGVGMDPQTLGKIFEPFFTTKESGTGLGLSTVYGIVKQHQGWIEASSEPGKGSTFKIFLPAVAKPPEAKQPPEPNTLSGSETILVVEDEPALRELVVRHLRKQGYKIIQASSGTEALAIWLDHAQEIDLLFTDMVMPDGMTGRDLAETLKTQKPEIKIIYTSGYSLEVVEQDFALRKGANFLQKPYQPSTLLKIVRASLDEHKVAV